MNILTISKFNQQTGDVDTVDRHSDMLRMEVAVKEMQHWKIKYQFVLFDIIFIFRGGNYVIICHVVIPDNYTIYK